MNPLRKHFLGTTAMFRVLTRVMFVTVMILFLSIAAIYGLLEFYHVSPTNKQIKDFAMTVWLATLIGAGTITIIRRRA